MIGFSHKTLDTSMLKVSANSGTVATHFPYSVNIFEVNCANILGNPNEIKNNRRCHLRCMQNLCKVDMTAGNNSDWLMRTLTLVTL